MRELILQFPTTATLGLIAARSTGNMQSFFVMKQLIEQVGGDLPCRLYELHAID